MTGFDYTLLACSGILLFAASFHFYWALGGHVGVDLAIPQRLDESHVFKPRPAGTMIVAVLLLCIAIFITQNTGLFLWLLPVKAVRGGTGFLAIIFLIRALSWSKYVGFFKKIRTTRFARHDTLFYCPLCLFLGLVLGYASIQP